MNNIKDNYIEIEIDKLTNSIENAISGDSFGTEVCSLEEKDLISVRKGNGWKFDWKYEYLQEDRTVYQLHIVNNRNIIQGLISISDFNDHLFINLIETAPFKLRQIKAICGCCRKFNGVCLP